MMPTILINFKPLTFDHFDEPQTTTKLRKRDLPFCKHFRIIGEHLIEKIFSRLASLLYFPSFIFCFQN